MGQPIEVAASVIDDVLILDTDRSVTGQDGTAYASLDEARADDRFPGRLAARLFESDEVIDHVFIASNTVVLRRHGGWDDAAVSVSSDVVSRFFLFYPEAVEV